MIWYNNRERVTEKRQMCYEMANLPKKESGLPYDIWLDSAGCDRNVQHNHPRIKVSVNGELIPVILYSKTKIEAQKEFLKSGTIINWITEHFETLRDHWRRKLTDREALNLLAKY